MSSVAPAAPLARAGRDLVAALVVSLAAVSFYISSATLLFQGALAPQLPAAIGATLLGAVVLGLAAAWRGALPLASVGAEPATVPVLAAITAAVAAQASPQAAFATAVVALALTAALVGGAWWWMGRKGWGDLIRYIPYPVIGGFLGSVGWLMLTGGLGVSTATSFSLARAWGWLSGGADLRLLVGLGLGVLLWQGSLRIRHVLALPALIIASGVAVHAALRAAGLDLAAAREASWLLQPFARNLPAWPADTQLLAAVDGALVAQQAGLMVSAVIVATIALLLSDTSLEVAWDQRADINQDLRVLGLGNLVSAAAGGLVGGVSISRSVLNRSAGATGRGSNLALALLCAACLLGGGAAMALVPRPLLGGLLASMGLGMLKTWLLDSRLRLPRRDHLTVIGMVAVTATLGFLPAVCVGVLACCLDFALASAQLPPVRRLLPRRSWPDAVERSPEQARQLQARGDALQIVELQGMLFFGSATRLGVQLQPLLDAATPPEQLLLDFRHVHGIDSSAAQALARVFRQLRGAGVQVQLSRLSAEHERLLRGAGCFDSKGPALHADVDAAVAAWDDAQLDETQATEVDPMLTLGLDADRDLLSVHAVLEEVRLDAGQALFVQGDVSDALYVVQSGRLSALLRVDGRERAVRSIRSGGAIGEMGLFRELPRSATVVAEVPSVVLRLSRERLREIEATRPAAALALQRLFLGQLAGRLEQANAQAHALSH